MSVSENKQEEKGEKEEKTGETEEETEKEESGARRGLKRKISLTRCDVCETEDAKYRCPNCLKFSCSLSCVKQHKQESGCSGVRDQTAFVRLSQFSEINLLNDYRFLEETARVADKPNRDTLLHTHPHHSVTVKLVRKNAAAAKVNLKILPKSFSRRRENSSIYIKAEQKLYWHLKLHFPQSDAQYTDRVPEDRLLEQILSDYVHPTESDPVKRQRLKLYVLAAPDRLSVFMKSEQRQPGSLRYHELDVKKSLRENLMFKTVVEYPELYVVLKEQCQKYLTRFPERKSVSSEPNGSSTTWEPPRLAVSSRDDPEPPEDLKHREKRRKCVADCSELEEGEIRSEEEEDEVEEHVGTVGHAKEPKGLDADRLPHKDDSSSDDEDDDDDDDGDEKSGTSSRQNETMDTNAPPSHNPGEDGDGKVQVDAAAVNNQNPAMKTDLGLPHEGEEEEMEEEDGQDGQDGQDSTANNHNGTIKTNDPPAPHDRCEKNEEGHPPPLGHGGQVGDEGQVHGVIDQKVTMNVELPLPPQAMDEDDVLDAALDQKVATQTTASSLRGLPEDEADGGADRAVATVDENVTTDQVDGGGNNADDQKMIMETDAHLPPGHGELVGDEGQVHGGGDSASAVNDQKVTMEMGCLPSSAHDCSSASDCGEDGGEDGGEVLVHSDGDRAPAVNDQKISNETDGLPSASLDENVGVQDGDQDGADGHVIGPVQPERVDPMERPPTDGLV